MSQDCLLATLRSARAANSAALIFLPSSLFSNDVIEGGRGIIDCDALRLDLQLVAYQTKEGSGVVNMEEVCMFDEILSIELVARGFQTVSERTSASLHIG